ncbi:MAG: RNA polymerase sigma factor [Solirubrobacterales bacterium]
MHVLDPQTLPAHTDRLYRAAWALCGSREEAEDLVQETFAKVLEKRRVVRGTSDLAYLLRGLNNTFISSRRAAGSRPQLSAVELEDAPAAVAARAHPETSARVREIFAAIAGLPEEFRTALVAVDVTGLSYAEAAAALGLKQSTLATRVFRARTELIDRFEERGSENMTGPRGLVENGGEA